MTGSSDHWSSRLGFVLAIISSAIGLGSIWKFPYELGANGGGVFLLVYVIGLLLVVGPLMLAELVIGRRGQRDAVQSMRQLAESNGASGHWGAVGGLGVIVTSIVLSYYSVIGGWAVFYTVETAIAGLPSGGASGVRAHFDEFLETPGRTLFFHAVFMAFVAVIVARGVAGGIEVAVKILMPLMVALLIALAICSLLAGNAAAALRFMFVPDWGRLSQATVLEALGLGFFSIGVGFATMMTYAAYASPSMDLGKVALLTLLADTAISLLAGLAVFPLVFAHRLDPSSGPGLVFVTLPLAFADMPFGRVAAAAFFACLTAAAVGSAISMLEMPVAYMSRRFGWTRPFATSVAAILCALAGFATVLSFSQWKDWRPLAAFEPFARASLFDVIDGTATNLLLPVAGIGISLFAGWVLPASALAEELAIGRHAARWLAILLRYVVPGFILLATLRSLVPQA